MKAFGREDHAGRWMSPKPLATLAAFAGGLVLTGLFLWADVRYRWAPLERYLLPEYLSASLKQRFLPWTTDVYTTVYIPRGVERFLPTSGDVIEAVGADGTPSLALSPAAISAGFSALRATTSPQDHEVAAKRLRRDVYQGRGLIQMFTPAMIVSGLALLGLLILAARVDRRRARDRSGRRTEGPRLVDVATFNRARS